MDVYGLDLNTFHPQNIGGLAPWVEAHPNSSETSCSCQSWSANQHRKAYGTGPQKTHYSGTHLWKFYGMWTSFRQLSSSPLASSNPCTRRITGLAKSARLSAPLRCTLSEIDSESLACRWAHLAVNTRAKSQKSQKSQIPTISNTCWNRAISWSWKHSTCWTKHAKVTHGKTKIWQSILTVLSQHYPALKLKIVATLKILGIHLSSLKILIFYIVPMI